MTTTSAWEAFEDEFAPLEDSVDSPLPLAPASAPVFVDGSGRRGRRLRGLGWLVVVCSVGFVAAMLSGLLGTQSQAPPLQVPADADTTPPSRYVNAPMPSPPIARPNRNGSPTAGASTTGSPIRATSSPTR